MQNFTVFYVNIQQPALGGRALWLRHFRSSPSARHGSDLEAQAFVKRNAINRGGARIWEMHKPVWSKACANVSQGSGSRELCKTCIKRVGLYRLFTGWNCSRSHRDYGSICFASERNFERAEMEWGWGQYGRPVSGEGQGCSYLFVYQVCGKCGF